MMEWGANVLLLAAAWLLYVVCSAVWRVYFSPLSKFPGPKLAALSLWNEFYWDVVKRGMFMWQIQEMHEKYGNTHSRCTIHLTDKDHRPLCEDQPI